MILYKDRLVRFGYEMIEYLYQMNGVEIEVIDNTKYSKEPELTDDFIPIITIFANGLYGHRSKKTKKLMDKVKANATDKENTTETDIVTGNTIPKKCRSCKMGIQLFSFGKGTCLAGISCKR